MWTALRSFMAAIRAIFRASSLSVLRLTLDHFQASSLVEQTSVLRLYWAQRSLIQPEGPHASITTRSHLFFLSKGTQGHTVRGDVYKLALAGLGFKKAAHGIELTKVESENDHV